MPAGDKRFRVAARCSRTALAAQWGTRKTPRGIRSSAGRGRFGRWRTAAGSAARHDGWQRAGFRWDCRHDDRRSFAWDARSPCLPLNGSIFPCKTWPARPPNSDTTAWNWPAGAITSTCSEALTEDGYCAAQRNLLERYELQVHAISAHQVGQAVLDRVDNRHEAVLPPRVWGDGDPDGVNARASEELKNTARAAQKLGVDVVNGFSGSSIWHLLYAYPPLSPADIDAGYELLAERFNPILDVFGECGIKFALEVHPTEIAFDLYTAERSAQGTRWP